MGLISLCRYWTMDFGLKDLYSFLGNLLLISSAVALGANIICNKIPGLAPKQRVICQRSPEALVYIGQGAKLGLRECEDQFKYHRWNCTSLGEDTFLGELLPNASREAAYTSAVSSAGITYSITQACMQGNLSHCGCDRSKIPGKKSKSGGFKWGGCSADIRHGIQFSKKFLDAMGIPGDERSLMNLHNHGTGRKAVKANMLTSCKCFGVSGSCVMKTCWQTLPPFKKIGTYLMAKYDRAKHVYPFQSKRPDRGIYLKLVRPKKKKRRKPRRSDLVYLEKSPNYCDLNPTVASIGTVGRICNRTSRDMDGCDLMCCGRGYNTHQYTRTWQCNCKFKWCCEVVCKKCSKRTEEYTCK
ncbi:protein Wnt-7b-like isoform X2 [Lineus longissimus]|uniref:protein Wnt-7b-like isoform X2 n=1 Tax=Lineus longissimus TaxID=88925 RepID=UPI002B4D6BA5